MDQNFVETLNELMAGSGISNNELGRRIEVDPAQVGRWRKGHGRPRPENLIRVAQVFNVDYRRLWALAYPEELPVTDGPLDPHLSAFLAEIEAGWRALDHSQRDLAERGARALFTVQPTTPNTNAGNKRADKRRQQVLREIEANERQGGNSGSDSTIAPWSHHLVDAIRTARISLRGPLPATAG
jgi:transcriptional regulator with XRE-family HTH domain